MCNLFFKLGPYLEPVTQSVNPLKPCTKTTMSSTYHALEALRHHVAEVCELELLPKPAGLAHIDPLNQNPSVYVRYASLTEWNPDQFASSVSRNLVDNTWIGVQTLSGPTMALRVFVDIRHGDNEEEHLEAHDKLLAVHRPNSRVAFGDVADGYELVTEDLSRESAGDVHRTTLTGFLLFELIEGRVTATGPTLEEVTVKASSPGIESTDEQLEEFVIQ